MIFSLFKSFECVLLRRIPLRIIGVFIIIYILYNAKNYKAVSYLIINQYSKNYYPIITYLVFIFYIILNANLVGLIPIRFSITSLGVLTLGRRFVFWLVRLCYIFLVSFKSNLAHFLPIRSPIGLSVILVWIEIASLGIRPLALGIRLIANITAGHLLLHLFSLRSIGSLRLVIGVLFFFIVLLELRVAVIQAYVFSLLLSLYINERLE